MYGLKLDPGFNSVLQLMIPCPLLNGEEHILEGLNKLTDNFVYSDIYDCLSSAMKIIKDHKSFLKLFFQSLSII